MKVQAFTLLVIILVLGLLVEETEGQRNVRAKKDRRRGRRRNERRNSRNPGRRSRPGRKRPPPVSLCPSPPNVIFAAEPHLTNQGVSATYTCLPGFRVEGGGGATVSTIHCSTKTLVWPSPPNCSQMPTASCPQPPRIDNAQSTVTNNIATYTCVNGHRLRPGFPSQIACVSLRWPTTGLPECELCPIPPNIAFASIPRVTQGGMSTVYTCIPGYRIVGGNGGTDKAIFCSTMTHSWQGVPSCEQIPQVSCSGPPSIQNAVSTVSDKIATYTCVNGYRLRAGSPSSIVCRGGSWPTSRLPVCEQDRTTTSGPVMCTRPPPCGGDGISREFAADSYAIGSPVRYTCITGFRIVGSSNNANNTASVFCRSDGTWTVTPTCEPVVCGVPTAGTNTVAVIEVVITFPNSFTYNCMTNFETSSSLVTRCLADGKFSLMPSPTCTQITCPASALPPLAYAQFPVNDVAVGETVTYHCQADFWLAPAADPNTPEVYQTTTCMADRTFTPLTQTCISSQPKSCREFFARDGMFAALNDMDCLPVLIDPQDGSDPAEVLCCKKGASELCTTIRPSGGAVAATSGTPCTGITSTTLPNTVFRNAGGAASKTCDSATNVNYPINRAQIITAIRSSGGSCKQNATITCTAADGLALALRCNGESSGFIYGTNAFRVRGDIFNNEGGGTIVGNIELSNYAYTGSVCDCARTGPASLPVGPECAGGCQCTTQGVGVSAYDTITKHLTALNPAYMTTYQITQHNVPMDSPVTNNQVVVNIGDIQCCETFVSNTGW